MKYGKMIEIIFPHGNATINIKNAGYLILLPQNDENIINLPKTAKLNLVNGVIKKSSIIWDPWWLY